MTIEINRTVPFATITTALVHEVYRATARVIDVPKTYRVSVAIVSNKAIQVMNRIYRKKDYPTDVLSFRYDDDTAEIILSAQKIRAQAKEYGHTQKMEAAFLLVHGLLHTLGWDHERSAKEAKEMRDLEVTILRRCGIECAR